MIHKKFLKTAGKHAQSIVEGHLCRKNVIGLSKWTYLKSKTDSKSLVFFLHGTGNDRLFLAYDLFLALLDNGHSILSVDLDGHGSESTSIFDEYSVLSCLSDWHNFAIKNFKFEKFHVIGNSLGGLVGVFGVAVYQFEITSLTLIGVPEQIDISYKEMSTELVSPFDKSYIAYYRHWGLNVSIPAIGPFLRKKYPFRMVKDAGSLEYVEQVSRLSRRLSFRENIIKIKCPILAIFGRNDLIAPIPRSWPALENDHEIIVLDSNHFLLTIQKSCISAVVHWLKKF